MLVGSKSLVDLLDRSGWNSADRGKSTHPALDLGTGRRLTDHGGRANFVSSAPHALTVAAAI